MGNQFALTTLLGALCVLPVFLLTEGSKFGTFVDLFKTSSILKSNLLTSGLYFYLYNELSTLTIKKTSAPTQSVANTAKRVIVMVYMAAVTGKALTEEQKIGAAVAITPLTMPHTLTCDTPFTVLHTPYRATPSYQARPSPSVASSSTASSTTCSRWSPAAATRRRRRPRRAPRGGRSRPASQALTPPSEHASRLLAWTGGFFRGTLSASLTPYSIFFFRRPPASVYPSRLGTCA